MRIIGLLFLFGISFICSEDVGGTVQVLDAENFDQEISNHNLILVEFYAPWCGHCKRLEPEYEKAAQELGPDFHLAKVDADAEKNKPLAQRFQIRGFPTLKLFRDGVPSEYQGGRTAADIVSYMKKQAAPVITPLHSLDEVEKFSQTDRVVIIGFFSKEDSEDFNTFKSFAEKNRDQYVFGEVVGKLDSYQEIGVKKSSTVILFKQFDEKKNILEPENFDTIDDFVSKNSVPLIDEIGPENFKRYVDSALPLAYLFVDLTVEGQRDQNVALIESVAKSSRGKVNFVYIDWAKYAKHSERLGLSGKVVPSLAIEDIKTQKHFAFDEQVTLTTEGIQKWVDSFLEGTLQPTIKSEEIPETNDGPVKVVVAKSYDQIVNDPTKDVLVEFYAPWCGHCKKLAPIYDQVGETFKNNEKIVIAKVDATANDIDPQLGIRGFPTIKFFPSNDKANPIDYNGDRSFEDLVKFVKEKAKIAKTKDEL